MGATYGLGVISGAIEADAPRETAIALLRAIAAFAEVSIRDRLADGEIVEVSPSGELKTLTGETAETLARAIEGSSNSRPYSAFSYLDGYHVLVPGAGGEGEPENLPDGAEIYVGSVESLVKRLDGLLTKEGIDPIAHGLHQELRALCDKAIALRVSLVLGS
jgi:hypothetical protein